MVEVPEDCDYYRLRELAFAKLLDFFPHIIKGLSSESRDYRVNFKGGADVEYIPGTTDPFRLDAFKNVVGLPWARLAFGLNYGKYIILPL